MGRPGRLVALDRAVHAAFAPVVGGQCEVPVAEHRVQPLQVVERGPGRSQHVAPVVAEDVLLEGKIAPGRRHELPHPRGLRRRHGLRVESAFDERQQRELGGHVARFEFLDDVEQVAASARRHALDVVRTRGVPAFAVPHQFGVEVRHPEAAPHPCPEVVLCGAVLEVDGDLRTNRVDRIGHGRPCAFIVKQRVDRCLRRFGSIGLRLGGGRHDGCVWARCGRVAGGRSCGRRATGPHPPGGQGQQSPQRESSQGRMASGCTHLKSFFHWRRAAKTDTGSVAAAP